MLLLFSIIEYGGSHFPTVLVALLNCCLYLLDILKSKNWTQITGRRPTQNVDVSITKISALLVFSGEVLAKMNKMASDIFAFFA